MKFAVLSQIHSKYIQIWHFYRTLSRGLLFAWTQGGLGRGFQDMAENCKCSEPRLLHVSQRGSGFSLELCNIRLAQENKAMGCQVEKRLVIYNT